jgi:hypothetical protein
MGVVHGGLAATLPTCVGCADQLDGATRKMFTTLELKITRTRPLTEEVGDVRCEARAFIWQPTATAEGRIVDDGKLRARHDDMHRRCGQEETKTQFTATNDVASSSLATLPDAPRRVHREANRSRCAPR